MPKILIKPLRPFWVESDGVTYVFHPAWVYETTEAFLKGKIKFVDWRLSFRQDEYIKRSYAA